MYAPSARGYTRRGGSSVHSCDATDVLALGWGGRLAAMQRDRSPVGAHCPINAVPESDWTQPWLLPAATVPAWLKAQDD
jgi:hypothetical protein